jgi:hypothetical protein
MEQIFVYTTYPSVRGGPGALVGDGSAPVSDLPGMTALVAVRSAGAVVMIIGTRHATSGRGPSQRCILHTTPAILNCRRESVDELTSVA